MALSKIFTVLTIILSAAAGLVALAAKLLKV